MVGDHRLVGGHNRFALGQRVTCQGERRTIGSANQLDHDIDIVARSQGGHIIFPIELAQIDATILGPVIGAHSHDSQLATGARRDQLAVGVEQPHNPCPDSAKPGQPDLQRFSH